MSKSIEQIKAAFKYEKEKMHKRLQVKEESLKIHIAEMDRLRKENNRLKIMEKNLITLEDAKDKILGKIGTKRRDKYEAELKAELERPKKVMSRSKIVKHYKTFFGLQNSLLGENDELFIDWAESLVEDAVSTAQYACS